jgi:hypothetical protein
LAPGRGAVSRGGQTRPHRTKEMGWQTRGTLERGKRAAGRVRLGGQADTRARPCAFRLASVRVEDLSQARSSRAGWFDNLG